MTVTKAIILAAGIGKRIKSISFNKPKCLIKIPNKKTSIIERQIKILKKNNIKDILIITGYKSNILRKKLSKFNNVRFGYYPYYKKTNNLNTLHYFKDELNTSTLCIFADVIFCEEILKKLLTKRQNIVAAIDKGKSLKDTMRVKVKKKYLSDIGSHIPTKKSDGNFIGICKFSKKGSILLKKNLIILKKKYRDYYTVAIKLIIEKKYPVNYLDCKNFFWKEVDTLRDYNELKKINSFR